MTITIEHLSIDEVEKMNEDDLEWYNAVLNCVQKAEFPNGIPMQINLPIPAAIAIAKSLRANLPEYYFTVERM